MPDRIEDKDSGLTKLNTIEKTMVEGNVITSHLTFHRIFPDQPPGHINLGLIHLEPGSHGLVDHQEGPDGARDAKLLGSCQ